MCAVQPGGVRCWWKIEVRAVQPGDNVPLSATCAVGCHPHSGMLGLFPCHNSVSCLPTRPPSSTANPPGPSSPFRCLRSCQPQRGPSRHIRGALGHRRSLRQLPGPSGCALPLPSPAGKGALIFPSGRAGGRGSIRARTRAGPRGRRCRQLGGSCGPGGLCCEPRGCARRHRPLLHPHAAGRVTLVC